LSAVQPAFSERDERGERIHHAAAAAAAAAITTASSNTGGNDKGKGDSGSDGKGEKGEVADLGDQNAHFLGRIHHKVSIQINLVRVE